MLIPEFCSRISLPNDGGDDDGAGAGWLIYSRHDLRELFNSNSPDPLMTNILMVDQEEGGKGRGGARGR